MAPLLKVLIQFLPALPSTARWSGHKETPSHQPALSRVKSPQQAISPVHSSHRGPSIRGIRDQISSVSWGENRVDVFHLIENNLTHKYWDGSQWHPPDHDLETLGNGLATPPVAISWGADRLDVFGLDDHNVIKHQYWDGTAWQPHTHELENLGGACDPQYAIAAATWGEDRLDVFCVGLDKGDLLHQYYDGSQWQPTAGSLESLGGHLAGDLSVVSWGKDRLDIFSVNEAGSIVHLYWDGSQWTEWATFKGGPVFESTGITANSWGKDRLDIFGNSESTVGGKLYHIYWDGTQWSDFESLDDDDILNFATGRASVTSWAPNRLDVVMTRTIDQTYYYKYWDGIGQSWRPSTTEWYSKSTADYYFTSNPTAVSWGENRLDIFGLGNDRLLYQAWTGSGWYPDAADWEILGTTLPDPGSEARIVIEAVDEEFELRK
ncbi:MAG: hypothetical protein Q9208_008291 [Pyrenodesmia sp. 3 TL-2023]